MAKLKMKNGVSLDLPDGDSPDGGRASRPFECVGEMDDEGKITREWDKKINKKIPPDYYDPKNLVPILVDQDEDDDLYVSKEIFLETKDDNLFHIGQTYDKQVASTVFCKHCGGKEFNVGIGDYYTAIKCVNCGWEKCIHEG